MMLMQSMMTKKYISEVFSWQYSYYTLNNEGIKFLREFLGVGENVVPETMKRKFHNKKEGEEDDSEERTRGRGRGRGRGGRGRPFKDEHVESSKDKTEEKPAEETKKEMKAPELAKENAW